jgi:hypothetical protein
MIVVVGIELVFSALVMPPILVDAQPRSSLACDMLDYLQLINFFVEHPWSFINFPGNSDALPGQHILLAWAARALGYRALDSTTVPIRLLHATFGLVFSLLLFLFLYRLRRDDSQKNRLWTTLALWISVAPSFYFIQSSIFISTDMPAATIYLVFLYLAVFHSQAIVAITLSATALIFWRQIYAPVLAAPLLANPKRFCGPFLLTLAVPAAVLLFYIMHFGGFTPSNSTDEYLPESLFQVDLNSMGGLHIGFFPQSILHAFAFLGLVSPIYLTIFSTVIQTAYRTKATIITASVISLLIAAIWIIVPSTFDLGAGRSGSIVWNLGRIGPIWSNHSLMVLLLGIIGAVFVTPLIVLGTKHDEIRPVLLGFVLYIAGLILMPLAFQRYVEPVALISLALIAASFVFVETWRVSLFALIFVLYSLTGLLRIYSIVPDTWLIPIPAHCF